MTSRMEAASHPELFDRKRGRRGWPEIPPPLPRPEVAWTPLSPAEIMRILDGGA